MNGIFNYGKSSILIRTFISPQFNPCIMYFVHMKYERNLACGLEAVGFCLAGTLTAEHPTPWWCI